MKTHFKFHCWAALLGIILTMGCGHLQGPAATVAPGSQVPQQFTRKMTESIRTDYWLHLPRDYQRGADKRWPLILFLHGAGERGSNVFKVLVHGPPKVVGDRSDFPFIVVSPQCAEGEWWQKNALLSLLDHVTSHYAVDTNRIYLTGLSMGGYGTWMLGISNPERFAAIAPICGGGETVGALIATGARLEALKSMGVWAFHGGKDETVRPEESERMVAALKRRGCADVQLTIYPEASHDSWTETYNNPGLYDWFLQHDRSLQDR